MSYPFPRPPVAGPPRPWRFPSFSRTRLDNGVDVLACPLGGQQLVTVRLVSGAGATAERTHGAATLLARSLAEGTEERDGEALTLAIERLGASIAAEASWDALIVTVQVPARNWHAAVDLLAEVVTRPALPTEAVERLRRERFDELRQIEADAGARAQQLFEASVFAPGSTYARVLGGDAGDVDRLDADALRAHHAAWVAPGTTTLVVAGDISSQEATEVTAQALGAWDKPSQQPPSATAERAKPHVLLVDRPGSVQSGVVIGHAGPPRTTPDYPAARLIASVLADSFTGRLFKLLREEKGYTYGVAGGFDFRREGGVFRVFSPVRTDATVDSVAITVAELRDLHRGGTTDDELAMARDALVDGQAVALQSPAAVARAIADLAVFGLPDDEPDRTRDAYGRCTIDGVHEVAQRLIEPDNLVITVVGDAGKIGPGLDEFGIVETDRHI